MWTRNSNKCNIMVYCIMEIIIIDWLKVKITIKKNFYSFAQNSYYVCYEIDYDVKKTKRFGERVTEYQ
jgi:hypothetical protein